MTKIKLMKYYVTNEIDKQAVRYTRLSDCVLITAKGHFSDLGKIFKNHINYDKDILLDYSKNDFVKIYPNDSLWKEACARAFYHKNCEK